MRKISLRNVLFSIFAGFTAFFINSCMEPPNFNDFLNDEDVQDKLERDRVNLTSVSDAGLIIGDKRISGLNPNKYYMIKTEKEELKETEEEIEKKTIKEFGFISKDGRIVTKLEDIGKTTVITHLSNGKISGTPVVYTAYTVNSATPMTAQLYYYENLNDDKEIKEDTPKKPFPANHTISASEEGKFHFLDLGSLIKEDHKYEIFIPDPNPNDEVSPVSFLTKNILRMSRTYLSLDYLFVERNNDGDITNFRILTVNLQGKTQEDGTIIQFSITYSGSIDNQLEITSDNDNNEYTQDTNTTITFQIENHDAYSYISWYTDVDGPTTTIGTDSFTMNFKNNWPDYQIIGTYIIYVIAKHSVSGEFYEAVITITVKAE